MKKKIFFVIAMLGIAIASCTPIREADKTAATQEVRVEASVTNAEFVESGAIALSTGDHDFLILPINAENKYIVVSLAFTGHTISWTEESLPAKEKAIETINELNKKDGSNWGEPEPSINNFRLAWKASDPNKENTYLFIKGDKLETNIAEEHFHKFLGDYDFISTKEVLIDHKQFNGKHLLSLE